jgi:hypothetical protein
MNYDVIAAIVKAGRAAEMIGESLSRIAAVQEDLEALRLREVAVREGELKLAQERWKERRV